MSYIYTIIFLAFVLPIIIAVVGILYKLLAFAVSIVLISLFVGIVIAGAVFLFAKKSS